MSDHILQLLHVVRITQTLSTKSKQAIPTSKKNAPLLLSSRVLLTQQINSRKNGTVNCNAINLDTAKIFQAGEHGITFMYAINYLQRKVEGPKPKWNSIWLVQ